MACGGSVEETSQLHDALHDCKALAKIMSTLKVTLEIMSSSCRSLKSVIQRCTNPILKAGLITDTVALKMTEQLSCESYLSMSDEEVTKMFLALGVRQASIKICLNKRSHYMASSNSL